MCELILRAKAIITLVQRHTTHTLDVSNLHWDLLNCKQVVISFPVAIRSTVAFHKRYRFRDKQYECTVKQYPIVIEERLDSVRLYYENVG